MKKLEIMNSLSRTVHKVGFQLKKHSPEILITAGVVGTVTSAVMACKATTKVGAILDKTKENIEDVHYALEHPEACKEEYTEEDAKKDIIIYYTHAAIDIAKLYAPAVLLGALSITAIITSNNILRKRNIALAAAYATEHKLFKEYRGRIVERFGDALDKEIRYNIKAQEVEEVVVNEKGEEETVKKTINVVDPNTIGEYAKFFDEYCAGWTKDPELNMLTLQQQQNFANQKLKEQGYLFLNEVFDSLGIPRTKAGQVVGWVYDEEHPNGDNFVDFGIFDANNERARAFVNGYEQSILLDFNVDGYILDLL